MISKEGVSADPSKFEAVVNWPKSRNAMEIKSFLGLASYYRRFVQDFSSLAAPMMMLTRKNEKLAWTAECERSFQELKNKLMSTPVLALPLGSGRFVIIVMLPVRDWVVYRCNMDNDCLFDTAVETP